MNTIIRRTPSTWFVHGEGDGDGDYGDDGDGDGDGGVTHHSQI